MRAVIKQEGAHAAYRQRKAMVEPVFSELGDKQGLNRFRRKGLEKVRTEFSLHVIAYNLGRWLKLPKLLPLLVLIGLFFNVMLPSMALAWTPSGPRTSVPSEFEKRTSFGSVLPAFSTLTRVVGLLVDCFKRLYTNIGPSAVLA